MARLYEFTGKATALLPGSSLLAAAVLVEKRSILCDGQGADRQAILLADRSYFLLLSISKHIEDM